MDRVYEADSDPIIIPAPPSPAVAGYPRQGDPGAGIQATEPGAHWHYMITEELHYLIIQAGLSANHTDYHQVHAAVAAMIAAGIPASSPAGTLVYFPGQTPPSGWLERDGSALSRATYADLFNAITIQDTGDTLNASPNITGLTDISQVAIGMPISGPGIPAATTVASIVSGSEITISNNATATATGVAIVVAPFGIGDGTTTFNIPDDRGEFERAWDHGRGIDSGRIFGSTQADALQGHDHSPLSAAFSSSGNRGGIQRWDATAVGTDSNSRQRTTIISDDVNGTPRVSTETRPRNRAYLAIIKY